MNSSFKLNQSSRGVWYFSIPEFEKQGGIRTFFSTRIGGVSKGECMSLNFGGNTADLPENTAENRRRILEALEIEDCSQACVSQVHGSQIHIILSAEDAKNAKEADSLVTNQENILLYTLHADCLPLYFFDPIRRIIGTSHAGWRGTCQLIAVKTIEAMENTFGSKRQDIQVAIGPGIGLCCFEVGKEVCEEFQEQFNWMSQCAVKMEGEKYRIDLARVNQMQLEEIGVSQVFVSGYCTVCSADLFYSHRREKGKTGRMGGGLILVGNEQ